MRDRLRLHGGVDHHPFEVAVASAPLLCATDKLSWTKAPSCSSPNRFRQCVSEDRSIERQPVTEAQFAAEELVIRVLQPARAQDLVRQVVHVLQDEQPPSQARW